MVSGSKEMLEQLPIEDGLLGDELQPMKIQINPDYNLGSMVKDSISILTLATTLRITAGLQPRVYDKRLYIDPSYNPQNHCRTTT